MGKVTVAKVRALTIPGRYGDGDGLWLQVRGRGPTLKTRGNEAFVAAFTGKLDRAPDYHAAVAYASLKVRADLEGLVSHAGEAQRGLI